MNEDSRNTKPAVRATMLTLAEIATAIRAFNDGDTNAADSLAVIVAVVETYRMEATAQPEAA
ncbi:MAG: hypothetical protein O3A37_14525 [Planctomycetota bacterium]|nr:hypothetical protein [Planctomycetota bacterium]